MTAKNKSWVFCNGTMSEPGLIHLRIGDVAYFSNRSPDKPATNEDSFAVYEFDNGDCAICVADGAGGYQHGALASRLAVETFVDSLAKSSHEASSENAVRAFQNSQNAVMAKADGGGTTMIVAVYAGKKLSTYHVGDSGTYIFGGRGRVKASTTAQSPTGYAIREGLLDENDALHHEERHLVSGLLGMNEITISQDISLSLAPRDTVCVASDGLFDNLYTNEIAQIARQRPLEKASATLVETCQQRMMSQNAELPRKPDDLSIVLFRARY